MTGLPVKPLSSQFMYKVNNDMAHRFISNHFYTEAHPVEKEEFKNMYFKIKSHQNLKDRLSAASKLFKTLNLFKNNIILIPDDLREMEELPGPFLVDNMEDEASKLYGAHPERLYIILDGNIVYQVCSTGFNSQTNKIQNICFLGRPRPI